MYESLKKLLENSYAPYSNFKVAAVVETKDGRYFGGVNIENSAYPSGICAERNAIFSAITAGYKKNDFEAIYLMGSSDKFCFPCMACRQVIVEFFEKDKKIISVNKDGKTEEHTVEELCPFAFTSEDLK